MTSLTTLSHHSLHKYVDNECDVEPCITLAIQPEWLALVNSIKALWLQWGSWAVQYPCFPDTALSHTDAPPATVKLHICLAVEKVATPRRSVIVERRSRGWIWGGRVTVRKGWEGAEVWQTTTEESWRPFTPFFCCHPLLLSLLPCLVAVAWGLPAHSVCFCVWTVPRFQKEGCTGLQRDRAHVA